MLKIGDFALLSKISIHMLRYYDEIDLLKPAQIDNFTNYRYYDETQLPIANRIQALKRMGFSLTMIKQILNEYGDTNSLEAYLELQLSQKNEDLQALQRQITLLKNTIQDLKNSNNPKSFDIAVKEIPKRNVISCRSKLSWYSQEGELWNRLREETKELNVQFASPSYDVAVIYETDSDGKVDVEVQQSVVGTYPDTVHTRFKKIPAILVAALTCEGGYSQLEAVNDELSHWILENNYDLCGNIMNIYHISPKTQNEPEKLLTEVCFPIRSR
ncbi:MAG: MerR family transcriptional regulator [Virgibacillus proomii]|jgi:DNA-binding transcriptional MerR regulator